MKNPVHAEHRNAPTANKPQMKVETPSCFVAGALCGWVGTACAEVAGMVAVGAKLESGVVGARAVVRGNVLCEVSGAPVMKEAGAT